MAKQRDGIDVTMIAGADLSSYQYYIVEKNSTNDQVTVANAITDALFGVLQNKPATSGREALVRVGGHTKVMAGATITAGNLLSATTLGTATGVTPGTNTTTYVIGQCTVGASSGEIAEMVIWHGGRAA